MTIAARDCCGARDCSNFGPRAPQQGCYTEDCLYLDVRPPESCASCELSAALDAIATAQKKR